MVKSIEEIHQEIKSSLMENQFWDEVLIVPRRKERIDKSYLKELTQQTVDMYQYPNLKRYRSFTTSRYDDFFSTIGAKVKNKDNVYLKKFISRHRYELETLNKMLQCGQNYRWYTFYDNKHENQAHLFLGDVVNRHITLISNDFFDFTEDIKIDEHLLMLVSYDFSNWNGEIENYDQTGMF